MNLNDYKLNVIVQQIIRSVDVLQHYYLISSRFTQTKIINNLKESYKYECKQHGRVLSIHSFIEDIESTIGWDFVVPDDKLVAL
jgi:trehalose/maltose hydrolase-like predicted phosphorylase